jgi:hypothetical protein
MINPDKELHAGSHFEFHEAINIWADERNKFMHTLIQRTMIKNIANLLFDIKEFYNEHSLEILNRIIRDNINLKYKSRQFGAISVDIALLFITPKIDQQRQTNLEFILTFSTRDLKLRELKMIRNVRLIEVNDISQLLENTNLNQVTAIILYNLHHDRRIQLTNFFPDNSTLHSANEFDSKADQTRLYLITFYFKLFDNPANYEFITSGIINRFIASFLQYEKTNCEKKFSHKINTITAELLVAGNSTLSPQEIAQCFGKELASILEDMFIFIKAKLFSFVPVSNFNLLRNQVNEDIMDYYY